MMQRKLLMLCLVSLQTQILDARWFNWQTLNERLAALNPRAAHADRQLPDDEHDAGLDQKLINSSNDADDGKILRLRDVKFLKQLAAKKGNNHAFAQKILLRNRGNVVQAAREVKCILIALITSVVVYRNRELLGKKWDKLKDIISGIAIVWGCYMFRHQLANGVSSVVGIATNSSDS